MPSIEKVHRILELLRANCREGLSNRQISDRLGIPASTCYRILAALRRFDYVQQRRPGMRYVLGFAHLRFAESVVEGTDAAAICRPFLEELHRETGQTAFLALVSGRHCVTMDTCGRIDTRISVGRGEIMPLHASAAGKAVLAFLPPREQQQILRGLELERFTEATIGDRQALERELREIRSTGVSYNLEEFHNGINALAVPIFGGLRQVVGAIAAVGISADLDAARLRGYAQMFREASERISRRLGAEPPREIRRRAAAGKDEKR